MQIRKDLFMLEITNIRNGAVLNHHDGFETDDCLEIIVEGIASPQSTVTVNGVAASRYDRNFSAKIRLTEKINTITATASDNFGDRSLSLTVMWDKKSYKRYNFFIDDCSFFLRWIALNKPESIFEDIFLGRLREINRKYGSHFMLNLFYHDDHHDFCIADFPEDYKEEFQANKDWLRLSFHAKSEFPDRPYQNATAEQIAEDFDLVYNEICRFAGAECFIPPMVLHWAMTNPANFEVLRDRGVTCLDGGYIDTETRIGEKHSLTVTDVGYHYEKDVACYLLQTKKPWYDRNLQMLLLRNNVCCNLRSIQEIEDTLNNISENNDIISLASHEQYSYPDYFNYLCDHLDRIETACRIASAKGYKASWFPYGILGNTAWDK